MDLIEFRLQHCQLPPLGQSRKQARRSRIFVNFRERFFDD